MYLDPLHDGRGFLAGLAAPGNACSQSSSAKVRANNTGEMSAQLSPSGAVSFFHIGRAELKERFRLPSAHAVPLVGGIVRRKTGLRAASAEVQIAWRLMRCLLTGLALGSMNYFRQLRNQCLLVRVLLQREDPRISLDVAVQGPRLVPTLK